MTTFDEAVSELIEVCNCTLQDLSLYWAGQVSTDQFFNIDGKFQLPDIKTWEMMSAALMIIKKRLPHIMMLKELQSNFDAINDIRKTFGHPLFPGWKVIEIYED